MPENREKEWSIRKCFFFFQVMLNQNVKQHVIGMDILFVIPRGNQLESENNFGNSYYFSQ